MAIPDPVRELAVYPFRVLPKPPDVERVQFDGAWASFNPWPSAQMVFLEGDGPSDVAAVVEAIREAGASAARTRSPGGSRRRARRLHLRSRRAGS